MTSHLSSGRAPPRKPVLSVVEWASCRNIWFGSEVGQICHKWDQSGIFQIKISVHFGSARQNVLKLILKSPRFVPLWSNLTQFGRQIWLSVTKIHHFSPGRLRNHFCHVYFRLPDVIGVLRGLPLPSADLHSLLWRHGRLSVYTRLRPPDDHRGRRQSSDVHITWHTRWRHALHTGGRMWRVVLWGGDLHHFSVGGLFSRQCGDPVLSSRCLEVEVRLSSRNSKYRQSNTNILTELWGRPKMFFFWNNSQNIDIWILRKEQNLFRSEFYMGVPNLVKIDWELAAKNRR